MANIERKSLKLSPRLQGFLLGTLITGSLLPAGAAILLKDSLSHLNQKEISAASLPPDLTNNNEIHRTIKRWLDLNKYYNDALSTNLTLGGTQLGSLVSEPLHNTALQHLIDGVSIAKTSFSLKPEQAADMKFNPKDKIIHMLGRDFNLNNDLHFHLSSSILENLLLGKDGILDDITWLYDENPNITIDKNSFIFISTERLTSLSRLLQNLKAANLPMPKSINYINYYKDAPGAGWYSRHNHPNPFSITVTNRSSGKITEAHEFGHFLADSSFLDPQNPRLQQISQSSFDKMINEILQRYSKTINDIPVAKDKKGKPSLEEEYAVQFQRYFSDGPDFRLRTYLSSFEPDQLMHHLQTAEYQFFKNLWQTDFTNDGLQIKATQQHQVNSIVSIIDTDITRPGFLMRPDPRMASLDPNWPALFDGDQVRIIGGPVIVGGRDSWGEKVQETIFWKVRSYNPSYLTYSLIESRPSTEGWIPSEALGNTIK